MDLLDGDKSLPHTGCQYIFCTPNFSTVVPPDQPPNNEKERKKRPQRKSSERLWAVANVPEYHHVLVQEHGKRSLWR